MNERIKLLAKQCWDERPEGQLHFDNEKFAALVAAAARADEREECAKKASIALLGANKALTDRVLKAIRVREKT